MVVRSLDYWLNERGLVKEVSLSALQNTRLCIDATNYIQRLLTREATTFVAAVGGTPEIISTISEDLKVLKKYEITPVFVFSGISPAKRERPFINEDSKIWRRAKAWDNYEKGFITQSQAEFSEGSPIIPQDVIRILHRLFKAVRVEFVVAPYLNHAQMVYLTSEKHEKPYAHSLYGSNELLMFDGVDKVILDINFSAGTMSFTSRNAIMADMGVTSEQFLDITILAGFEHSPTFPGLDPQGFHFRNVLELVKSRGSGIASVLAFRDYLPVASTNYTDQFARARCMIKFSLVLSASGGRVLPLPLALPHLPTTPPIDIPSDLGDIFSPHLPAEIYYTLWRGLIAPSIIQILSSGQLIENAPLCGGTPEYERHIKYLTEPPTSARCVALALISSALHPLWIKKQVSAIYYFDPGRDYPIPHGSPQTINFIESASRWNVDAGYVESELRRQTSSTIDMLLVLGATASPSLAARTIGSKSPERRLDKKDQIVANVLWRFLELRSFFLPDPQHLHQHNPYARALFIAMKASRLNDKFQESLYLALELVRAGALHSGRIGTRIYSGGPNFQGSEEDKRSMLLCMRVMSIVPLAYYPGPWTGPLSRELLVFNSFLRATSRSLRFLLESISLNLILKDARKAREDYVDIALSLPFSNDSNDGMGILFKAFGDAVCHLAGGVDVVMRAGGSSSGTKGMSNGNGVSNGVTLNGGGSGSEVSEAERENVRAVKKQTLLLLEPAFPNVKNVTGELERGFRFWSSIMVAIRSLRETPGVISNELVKEFEAADKWLRPFELE